VPAQTHPSPPGSSAKTIPPGRSGSAPKSPPAASIQPPVPIGAQAAPQGGNPHSP
jgi:hypothetical protein